MTTHGSDLHAG